MTVLEMREKRATLIAQARAIVDDAAKFATADGRQQYDRIMTEADDFEARYVRQEKLEKAEKDAKDSQGVETRGAGVTAPIAETRKKVLDAHRRWLATGDTRALQVDSDTAGGYLSQPEEFVAEYIKTVDDLCQMRGLSRKFRTTAQSLGFPKRAAKMASFAWGGELSTPTADTALKFGKRALFPHYASGEILVSRELLRANVVNPESIVMYEMGRDSAELEENAFMTGDGNQKPLGIFTASSDGISTARDFNSGNTTTTIGADNLFECKYQLKLQYRFKAAWIFSRAAIKMLRKLKDGEGQYLWQPGLQGGDPDRLLGLPVYESEFAPSTFTTGKYVGILGAYENYWIADALDLDLQRLVEKYAETNQVAFLARFKTDGMPVLEEAFARVTLA
jgi:HK97 family phage major capsid protein